MSTYVVEKRSNRVRICAVLLYCYMYEYIVQCTYLSVTKQLS